MFRLKIPVLVLKKTAGDVPRSHLTILSFITTNAAGDVVTSCQKYLVFCRHELAIKLSRGLLNNIQWCKAKTCI